MDRAEKAIRAIQALDAQRLPWEGLWQELADVCHPRRSLQSRTSSTTTPERHQIAEAFDGTAMRSNRTLAHGQFSRITPMGSRWFALRPPDALIDNQEAHAWYQQCGEIVARKLYASNFYPRIHEHYLDRGAFGTAATEVTTGKGGKGLHFRSYPIGTYSIAHNAQDEVDTLARTYKLTPLQLEELFPENLPASVRKKLEDEKESLVPLECVHLIRPRRDRDPRKVDPLNKPFESLHILKAEKHILLEGGYDEFPVAVSRWELWGDSPYGWAPSYLALPEATQLNFLEQMLDTLAEVSAFPRVLYPGNLKGDVDFRALGLTCYDPSNAQEAPREWLTGGRYDVGKDRAQDKRRAIEEAFFVPLFNAISQMRDQDITATQVQALVSESRELFHPIFAGLTRETTGPLIRRSFALLLRQGELPDPPPSVLMQDDLGAFIADPNVEYTSIMALALEQSQLANFADVLNVLAPVAQADPAVWDFLDTDRIGPAFFRYKGLPESFIRPPKAVAAIRESRAQAQQAAQAEQAAGAVQKLGGAQGISQLQELAGA